ncbi:MAG: restriction endonuclease subunit S [Patescibacteria group bacterium]
MTPNEVKIVADNIGDFIEVPDAIQRLRKAVFTLAIAGKLVSQNKTDGTAEQLYAQIKNEYKQLTTSEVAPFEIPKSWKWVKLGEVGNFMGGTGFPKEYQIKKGGEIPFFKVSDMNRNIKEMIDSENWISEEIVKKMRAKVLPINTIIFPKIGGAIATNKRRILIKPSCIDNNCLGYLPSSKIFNEWMFLHLTNIDLAKYQIGGAIPALNIGILEKILISLPPLAEQKRIIKKVNEVIKQLDELEIRKQQSDKIRTLLVHSAMYSLGNGKYKIAFENITELIKTSDDIKELENALLSLAVSGKLVKQDRKDGTAEELYKKIKKEKTEQINVKKKKSIPDILENEIPFEIPNTWKWVKFNDIGETNIGLTYSPNDISTEGIPVLRSTNIQKGQLDFNDLVRVKKEVKSSVVVQEGDLLICVRNGSKSLVGKTAMIKDLEEKMAFGAFMSVFRSECNPYVEVFLKSTIFRNLLEGVNTMTINQITQDNLKNTLIPLPPQGEQKRIVKKVEEIMVLINQLRDVIGGSKSQGRGRPKK